MSYGQRCGICSKDFAAFSNSTVSRSAAGLICAAHTDTITRYLFCYSMSLKKSKEKVDIWNEGEYYINVYIYTNYTSMVT